MGRQVVKALAEVQDWATVSGKNDVETRSVGRSPTVRRELSDSEVKKAKYSLVADQNSPLILWLLEQQD